MRNFLWIILAVLIMAIGVPNARADSVIVSNLSETPVTVDTANQNAAALSFTTRGTPETLADVVLKLLGSGGAVDVSLFSNNSGLPGPAC